MNRNGSHAEPIAETLPEPSPAGSVILEIGGDIGAAVVITTAKMVGAEIEIRREGGQWTGSHVAVLERRVEGGPIFAAVFPSLPAGAYQLRIRTKHEAGLVHRIVVHGGHVLTTNWPHP
jgi:hypothetical protein